MEIETYRFSLPGYWGELNPALQHNRYGDAILTNIFEPLVRIHASGVIYPRGAASWEVSDDYRVFKFKIDRTHAFSDGTKLSAKDYKRSWEEGLRLSPSSSNSSGADGLFDLVGFDEFQKNNSITGIVAESDDLLELHYRHPFRMAFNYLAGIRFAAFKKTSERPIGSGAFLITHSTESSIELDPNPFFNWKDKNPKKVVVSVVQSLDALKALEDGRTDAVIFSELSADLRHCRVGSSIECISGPEAGHTNMMLNSLAGRTFSNLKNRRALQFLVHQKLPNYDLPRGYSNFASRDPQTFFPLQKGRLSEDESEHLIEEDEKSVGDLIKEAERRPLYVVTVQGEEWVIDFLKTIGIKIDSRSTGMAPKQRLEMYYKTFEPDIVFGSFGVHYGDPDGLYHLLGTNGSISSPMLAKRQTAQLIDEGRHILAREAIDTHYQKVARSILLEVPYVHLFFGKNLLSFRTDKIKLSQFALETNELALNELIAD